MDTLSGYKPSVPPDEKPPAITSDIFSPPGVTADPSPTPPPPISIFPPRGTPVAQKHTQSIPADSPINCHDDQGDYTFADYPSGFIQADSVMEHILVNLLQDHKVNGPVCSGRVNENEEQEDDDEHRHYSNANLNTLTVSKPISTNSCLKSIRQDINAYKDFKEDKFYD